MHAATPNTIGLQIIGRVLRRIGARTALLFACILLPLWGFGELAEEVHELEDFVFDEPILMGARAAAGPWLDHAFLWLSRAGYEGVIAADIALVIVLVVLRHWREVAFAAVACAGSGVLNMATKHFFQRQRPGLWESIAPEPTFSFPSGHAMGSMTLGMVLVLLAWHSRWRGEVLALAATFVLLVGLSRVYLGVHYPSDILGGWAAGMAWVFGIYAAIYRAHRRPWRLHLRQAPPPPK